MMTALLIKDFYTLIKQAKIFLLIIVVFALIPGYSVSAMAIIYAAMLPMTALAYDERARWDSLAAMMPYSAGCIVLSKYLIGYIAAGGACVLSFAAQSVLGATGNAAADTELLPTLLLTASIALSMLAINMPVMFRFGVEKGRIVFLVMFGAAGAITMAMSDRLDELLTGAELNFAAVAVVLCAAVIINLISVVVSTALYKHKTF